MATPPDTPTSVDAFVISPHLQPTLLLPDFRILATLMGVKQHLIVASTCISLLSNDGGIFSGAYWPFVSHLRRNVHSSPLPSFKWDCLPFLTIMHSLRILDVSPLPHINFQIFSLILWLLPLHYPDHVL